MDLLLTLFSFLVACSSTESRRTKKTIARTAHLVSILMSGGIDSSACVNFYLEESWDVRGIFIDYGQAAAGQETVASRSIAKHFKIPLRKICITGINKKGIGVVQGRNALLLMTALMESSSDESMIAIGVHAGTNYSDCSPPFIRKMQSVYDMYTGGRIRIGAPFLRWGKLDIYRYCLDRHLPLHLMYSCERGKTKPCGRCATCRDIKAIHARA